MNFQSQALKCPTCRFMSCQWDAKHLDMCPDSLHSQHRDTGTPARLSIMIKSGAFTCLCWLCWEPAHSSGAIQQSQMEQRAANGGSRTGLRRKGSEEHSSRLDPLELGYRASLREQVSDWRGCVWLRAAQCRGLRFSCIKILPQL